jgi:hypothetical protein
MDDEDLGGSFLISICELGYNGLWNHYKQVILIYQLMGHGSSLIMYLLCSTHLNILLTFLQIFESRLPLQRVTLNNKLGKVVHVDRLQAQ